MIIKNRWLVKQLYSCVYNIIYEECLQAREYIDMQWELNSNTIYGHYLDLSPAVYSCIEHSTTAENESI